jgi:hypothetical protein
MGVIWEERPTSRLGETVIASMWVSIMPMWVYLLLLGAYLTTEWVYDTDLQQEQGLTFAVYIRGLGGERSPIV